MEDAIANIAIIFHWSPEAYRDMSFSDLIMWHQMALDRHTTDHE